MIWAYLLGFIVILIVNVVKILPEYTKAVVFQLGRLQPERGPGLFFLIPLMEKMVTVDMRTVTMDVPPQDIITKDNVTIKVNAVIYFRVVSASAAITKVENYLVATSKLAQTTLRSVVGQIELDTLLTERERINLQLQSILDEQTEPWGVKVENVEVKQVDLPENMQRAMARQAEAERDRRAKIIAADAELQASKKLAEAGAIIAEEPTTLQLRYLQTLLEMSNEKTTHTVVPIPINILSGLEKLLNKK